VVRLLLVDDEPDIRETVKELLDFSFPEIQVETAANGLDAMEKLKDAGIDAVLTDYRMPGMNGIDLVNRIRKSRPDLPTLMFTAYADEGTLNDLRNRAPGLEVLAKPVDVPRFLPRIRALLDAIGASRSNPARNG
jgi:CheY-like chemotaxis protein